MKFLSLLLFLLLSLPLSAQNYSKDLEKQAKKGDPTAQYETGVCYLYAKGVTADVKKAKKWLQAAADQGHTDALYEIAMLAKDEYLDEWPALMEKAANAGSGNAQYIMFKQSGDKKWLQMAADNGSPDALYELAKTTDDKEKKLDLLEKASNKGSIVAKREAERVRKQIEKEREKQKQEEEAKNLVEQQKAIEEGRLLPSYDFIMKNIPILNVSATYPKPMNYSIDRIYSLCKEDVIAYTERWNMDKLDKALYMKSDEYKVDLGSLKDEKSQIFAYMFDLGNDSYKNNKQFWADFDVDGITFKCYNIKNETLLKNAHIGIYQLAIPVQPGVTDNGYDYFFRNDDLATLKKVKDNLVHTTFVVLFKPAFSKDVNSAGLLGVSKREIAFVNPVAIYILDKRSGEAIMNLSEHIREIASEQGYKSEMTLIENTNKKEKDAYAKWVKDYKDREAKKKYHSVPKEERCWACWGSGKVRGVSDIGAVGAGPWQRCTICYGRGYTLEHYY